MRMSLRLPKFDITSSGTQRVLILTAAILILVFFYFFTSFLPVFYPPRAAEISELRGRVEKLSAEVEQAKRTAANLPRLEQEMAELHEKWADATKLLPPEKEMASLLRKVTVAGQQSGIAFTLFEPSEPVPAAFYTEHPVAVKVEGGFHDVGSFLASLAGMTRIVNVTNLDLAAVDQDNDKEETQNGGTKTVTAAMTITAYSLGSEHVDAIEMQGDTGPKLKAAAAKSNPPGEAPARRSTAHEE